MSRANARFVVGLAGVVFVTAIAAGAVAASAAVTTELTDGDGCEASGNSTGLTTVTSYAGNVTECITAGDDTDASGGDSTSESGRAGRIPT